MGKRGQRRSRLGFAKRIESSEKAVLLPPSKKKKRRDEEEEVGTRLKSVIVYREH